MDNTNQGVKPVLNTSLSGVTPTMSVTIPSTPGSTAPVTPSVKRKILVVDDEQDAKDLFAELLKTNTNYEVETAADGNEALDKCSKNKFDLVLLDIVMPNLDGVDTLSQIKLDPAKYGNPIVIMLTNIGGDIAIQEALKLGAVGYKLKIDTEPDELLETVAKAFETKTPVVTSDAQVTDQPAKAA